MAKTLAHRAYGFWFKGFTRHSHIPYVVQRRWLGPNRALDSFITQSFAADLEAYTSELENDVEGEYTSLMATPRGSLALVLLTDRFARNIHRTKRLQAAAAASLASVASSTNTSPTSGDTKSLDDNIPSTPLVGADAFIYSEFNTMISLLAITHGMIEELDPIERSVFYLPFIHGGNDQMTDMGVIKVKEELAAAPRMYTPYLKNLLAYAEEHHRTLRRFGRYPLRNPSLALPSNANELKYFRSLPAQSSSLISSSATPPLSLSSLLSSTNISASSSKTISSSNGITSSSLSSSNDMAPLLEYARQYFAPLPYNDDIKLATRSSVLTPSIGDMTTKVGQHHYAANLLKQFAKSESEREIRVAAGATHNGHHDGIAWEGDGQRVRVRPARSDDIEATWKQHRRDTSHLTEEERTRSLLLPRLSRSKQSSIIDPDTATTTPTAVRSS